MRTPRVSSSSPGHITRRISQRPHLSHLRREGMVASTPNAEEGRQTRRRVTKRAGACPTPRRIWCLLDTPMLRHRRSAAALPETGAQTRTVCGRTAHDARAASCMIYALGMRTANCRPAVAAGAGASWEQSPVSGTSEDGYVLTGYGSRRAAGGGLYAQDRSQQAYQPSIGIVLWASSHMATAHRWMQDTRARRTHKQMMLSRSGEMRGNNLRSGPSDMSGTSEHDGHETQHTRVAAPNITRIRARADRPRWAHVWLRSAVLTKTQEEIARCWSPALETQLVALVGGGRTRRGRPMGAPHTLPAQAAATATEGCSRACVAAKASMTVYLGAQNARLAMRGRRRGLWPGDDGWVVREPMGLPDAPLSRHPLPLPMYGCRARTGLAFTLVFAGVTELTGGRATCGWTRERQARGYAVGCVKDVLLQRRERRRRMERGATYQSAVSSACGPKRLAGIEQTQYASRRRERNVHENVVRGRFETARAQMRTMATHGVVHPCSILAPTRNAGLGRVVQTGNSAWFCDAPATWRDALRGICARKMASAGGRTMAGKERAMGEVAPDEIVWVALLPLDELIQVVYQGSSRFVVLSSVESDWTVHVGLSGPDGRWWRGAWGSKHIRGAVGLKASSDAIEAYADRLADAFAKGEMCIGNWSSQKGAKVNLVLGTTTDAPAHVALAELPAEEAAAFATKVFTNIAIQAQSRGSRLHPSPFAAVGTIATLPSKPSGLDTLSARHRPHAALQRTHDTRMFDRERPWPCRGGCQGCLAREPQEEGTQGHGTFRDIRARVCLQITGHRGDRNMISRGGDIARCTSRVELKRAVAIAARGAYDSAIPTVQAPRHATRFSGVNVAYFPSTLNQRSFASRCFALLHASPSRLSPLHTLQFLVPRPVATQAIYRRCLPSPASAHELHTLLQPQRSASARKAYLRLISACASHDSRFRETARLHIIPRGGSLIRMCGAPLIVPSTHGHSVRTHPSPPPAAYTALQNGPGARQARGHPECVGPLRDDSLDSGRLPPCAEIREARVSRQQHHVAGQPRRAARQPQTPARQNVLQNMLCMTGARSTKSALPKRAEITTQRRAKRGDMRREGMLASTPNAEEGQQTRRRVTKRAGACPTPRRIWCLLDTPMLRHRRSAAALPETGAQTRTVCGRTAHDARAASCMIYALGMRTANCRPAVAAGAGASWEQSLVSWTSEDGHVLTGYGSRRAAGGGLYAQDRSQQAYQPSIGIVLWASSHMATAHCWMQDTCARRTHKQMMLSRSGEMRGNNLRSGPSDMSGTSEHDGHETQHTRVAAPNITQIHARADRPRWAHVWLRSAVLTKTQEEIVRRNKDKQAVNDGE
ncbi:predicted protein [Postia placenta Mad-698-R]|nr:predicted protein [Postia placenta Mad-698-R]